MTLFIFHFLLFLIFNWNSIRKLFFINLNFKFFIVVITKFFFNYRKALDRSWFSFTSRPVETRGKTESFFFLCFCYFHSRIASMFCLLLRSQNIQHVGSWAKCIVLYILHCTAYHLISAGSRACCLQAFVAFICHFFFEKVSIFLLLEFRRVDRLMIELIFIRLN